MPEFTHVLLIAAQILAIILLFNLIIFVHELGHFLAARWRGLQVDRFQIWFGKPIWKKTIGGVQYGLGWIPAGGFVSLPQMAPMEAIEGSKREDGKILPPIKPLDKIIVAFAGPLFSLLLALAAAGIVSKIGKPTDIVPSTKIGSVVPGSPGEKAGIRPGDVILEVNGEKVSVFAGQFDGIFERIILSKGDSINFTIQRAGEPQPIHLTSQFDIPKSRWFQRRALRQVGLGPESDGTYIAHVSKGSPAERAGLKDGDKLVSIDGKPVVSDEAFLGQIKAMETRPFEIAYERKPKGADTWTSRKVTLQAEVPVSPAGKPPMIGIMPADLPAQTSGLKYPGAWEQVADSLNQMWVTLDRVFSRDSSIGIDHLSGPVGIAKVQYQMMQMDHPFNRILAFFVLFNVNLAVLNMLPFPVLDGGHILLALMEAISRRPVKARALEWVQTAFAVMLMGLMLYVLSKDTLDGLGRPKPEEIKFQEK